MRNFFDIAFIGLVFELVFEIGLVFKSNLNLNKYDLVEYLYAE